MSVRVGATITTAEYRALAERADRRGQSAATLLAGLIRHYLASTGVKPEPARVPASDDREERKAAAIRMYQSGMSQQRVASHIGVSQRTVSLWLRQAKVRARYRRGRPVTDDEIAIMRTLYAEGRTQTSIATELGVSQTAVSHYVRSRGRSSNDVDTARRLAG